MPRKAASARKKDKGKKAEKRHRKVYIRPGMYNEEQFKRFMELYERGYRLGPSVATKEELDVYMKRYMAGKVKPPQRTALWTKDRKHTRKWLIKHGYAEKEAEAILDDMYEKVKKIKRKKKKMIP